MHPKLILNKMLGPEDKQRIVEAIQKAETHTSGEIRVHIDRLGSKNPYHKATKVFERLGMTKTQERNGVLIFICFSKKQIVVLGDQGINEKVPEGFWNDIYTQLAYDFKQGEFAKGISEAVLSIGKKLSDFFPFQETDKNELDNEISEQ